MNAPYCRDRSAALPRLEASGRSATYEALAAAVADNRDVLAFLNELPVGKRQPNLLFAAARHVIGEVADIADLRALVISGADPLAASLVSVHVRVS